MKPQLSFEAQYGSENYRLNRPDSDVDMMYFYNPNFEDLYTQKMATDLIEDRSTDRKHHDVRKLPVLFYKANVNMLEILYSCNVKAVDELYAALSEERDAITTMNIPYLFEGCMGMYNRNYGLLDRDAHYVTREDMLDGETHRKKLGKHAAGAYRILDFMHRFANLGFSDFGLAIAYDASLITDRSFIQTYMDMRDGKYSFSELSNLLKKKETEAQSLKLYFKEKPIKEDVNQFVIETVREHVKNAVHKSLIA